MITFLFLFLIGTIGFVLLLAIISFVFNGILEQIYAIYIIGIAGAESAIDLAILVAFYRLRGSTTIEFK